jgi:hypothetical protein
MMTHLVVFGVFSPVCDSGVESEQKTNAVCLDLKTLEDGTEEGAGSLG